jgi:hypothetical protein
VSNEARLDANPRDDEKNELRCRDATPEVVIARDASHSRSERLQRYHAAIAEARSMEKRFDETFRRDPDLIYGAEAGEWQRRQHGCVELADRLERERVAVERLADDSVAPSAAAKKVAAVEAKPEEKKVEQSAADAAFEEDAGDKVYKPYQKKLKQKHKRVAHKGKKGKHVRVAAR